MVRCEVELNEDEMNYYHNILNKVKDLEYDEKSIVRNVAVRIGRHPLGYGCYSARIIEKDGKYYATWLSGSACD